MSHVSQILSDSSQGLSQVTTSRGSSHVGIPLAAAVLKVISLRTQLPW